MRRVGANSKYGLTRRRGDRGGEGEGIASFSASSASPSANLFFPFPV